MIDASLFEAAVSNYLRSAGDRWRLDRRPAAFDFLVEPAAGRRVALEVRAAAPRPATIERIRKDLIGAPPAAITEFALVTPSAPDPIDAARLCNQLAGVPQPHHWIGINGLPRLLGADSPGDLLAPDTMARLQQTTLVKSLLAYAKAPIGPEPELPGIEIRRSEPVASRSASLVRQLPFAVIQALLDAPGDLEGKLGLGQRVPNATVVLSDLKNFSSLVTASTPDVLNESMAKYYRRVRDAVFTHGGMLDKFIGDAVLAVFGYPRGHSDSVAAIRFATDLIAIGREVLGPWLQEVNTAIETGTRVGVATGDLWPLNIGQRELELTLLGDVINLAARLEKNCRVDGILIDNRTHTRIQSSNRDLARRLTFAEVSLAASHAKGQPFDVRAWQSPKAPDSPELANRSAPP